MTDPRPAVGVLGGTFDPVHFGHLAIADQAKRRLRLSRMLLLPTAVPPHKPRNALSPIRHRTAMLELALGPLDGFELCPLELSEDRVSFTIASLRALRHGPPSVAPVFLLGMDALIEIETWHEHQKLLEEFDLAVVDRPGRTLAEVRESLPLAAAGRLVGEGNRDPEPGIGGRIFHLPLEPIAISSSSIRARVAAGAGLEGLVPPAVAGYIQTSGLYRKREDRH